MKLYALQSIEMDDFTETLKIYTTLEEAQNQVSEKVLEWNYDKDIETEKSMLCTVTVDNVAHFVWEVEA